MAQFPSIAPKSNSDLAPIVGLAPTAPAVCWLSWWWPYVPVAWLACPSSMGAGAAVGAGKKSQTPLRLLSVWSPACAQISALRAAPDTPAQLGELV